MTRLRDLPQILRADAETKWARLQEALRERGIGAAGGLDDRPGLPLVLACSDFVAEVLIRSPELLAGPGAGAGWPPRPDPGGISRRLAQCLKETADAEDLGARLRRFRRGEMVGIACRDLLGLADLEATMADLTALAETCIEQALAWLHDRLCAEKGVPAGADGRPQRLVVLGLGKLGAAELNFSSDVDLVFAYPRAGEIQHAAGPMTHEEFFTRLCRQLIHAIGALTPDGFVFRVDLRLRPFGDSGPLVMSFDALEHYYQEQGRDWERYAWIKARVVAGDRCAGESLLERLQPFVFRRYLDFGAFESLRAMKQMITQEIARKGMAQDIKLGPGGIREIEFFGQIFQLIRGGVVPRLKERQIRKVLAALAGDGLISAPVHRELDAAYVFLRRVEHRLQEAGDQQTHDLPRDDLGWMRLAAAMGFDRPADFQAELGRHREAVHGHFRLLLESPADPEETAEAEHDLSAVWLNLVEEAEALAVLSEMGFDPAQDALRLLNDLRGDPETRALSPTGRQRLDRLIPAVIRETSGAGQPLSALRRTLDLIRAIERRTSYLALLLEYPAALRHLIRLADASPWVASFLAQHPVLLDELLDQRTLYRPPDRTALAAELKRRIDQAPSDDLECQIEELCIFKQVNVLRVAAADVSGRLPLMRVSDYLSDIAETAVHQVVELAWVHLAQRHGTPAMPAAAAGGGKGFAVIAYGKLGGLELGYGSDLDLVFLHAAAEGLTAGGPQPIDNAQFFNRLGQRVIHLLTSHTRAGRVYEIDTRLRPSGISGVLVRHIDAFRDYQLNEAWTWEHQALIKARPVCGEPALAARFEAIRAEVLRRRRAPETLCRDVVEMRERMRRERHRPAPELFDLKEGPGGIIDIEFLVQYLVLRHARRFSELARWTDTVRLIRTLIESAVINEFTGHILKHAYLIYRAAAHQLSLQEKPSKVPLEKFDRLQARIQRIWEAVMTAGKRAGS
jgi:glutamate-ammonia-ligase adenylyltransferase